MTYTYAKELCRKNIDNMTLEQLQKHKVKLIDAWRESEAQYGFVQAVRDGFYQVIECEYASGFTPRDMFLTQNLDCRLNETENKLKFLLGVK